MFQIRLGAQKGFYVPKYSGVSVLEIDGPVEYMNIKLCDLGMALCWNAIFKAAEGNINEATNELISGYRLGHHMSAGPKSIYELIIGMAVKQPRASWASEWFYFIGFLLWHCGVALSLFGKPSIVSSADR